MPNVALTTTDETNIFLSLFANKVAPKCKKITKMSKMAQDDIIDDYFIRAKDTLIDVIAKQPDDGEYALDLLMITKYFERIGDHATNIAEWVIFSVTGEHKEG